MFSQKMANAIRRFRNCEFHSRRVPWISYGYSNSIYPSDIIVTSSPPEIGYYFTLFPGGFNGRDIAQMAIIPFNVRAHRRAAYRAAARNQYDIIARFNEGDADSQQHDILDIVKLPVTDWSYSLTRPRYRCYKCSCRSNWIKVGQTECHKLHGESEREKR